MKKLQALLVFLAIYGSLLAQDLTTPNLLITPRSTSAGGTGRVLFYELSANGENFSSFQAADAQAATLAYTLPAAYPGTSGFALTSTTAGVMSWVSGASITGLNCGGVAGAVCFFDGTNLAGDAAKFFWDNTNKRLGIGTNTPSTTLQLSGTANAILRIDGAVTGAAFYFNSQTGSGQDRGSLTTNAYFDGAWNLVNPAIPSWLIQTRTFEDDYAVLRAPAGTSAFVSLLTTLGTGNTGVGVSSPQRILHVNKSDASAAGMVAAQTSVTRLTNPGAVVGSFVGVAFHHFASDLVQGMLGVTVTSGISNGLGDMVFGVKAASTATDVTEYVRLQGGGNLGIGTNNPQKILHQVKSDGGSGMAVARTAVHRITNSDGTVVGSFAGVAFHHFSSDLVQGMLGTVTTSGANNGLGDMVFGVKAASTATDVTEYVRLVGSGYWKFSNGTAPAGDPTSAFNFWSAGGEWLYRSALASEGSGGVRRVHNRGEHVAAAGTAYTFTASLAYMAFGTTNPEITLPTTGVYRIEGRLTINKVGATTANENLFVVLRNGNTSTNIENGVLIDLGVSTTLTETFETITWSTIYTQNTAGEVIKIAGNLSATPSAGSIQTSEGYIQYVRLF